MSNWCADFQFKKSVITFLGLRLELPSFRWMAIQYSALRELFFTSKN